MHPADALASLRALLSQHDLAAWVVPSADPHQSEYVSANWLRRGFITGFTGSAGTAVILAESAGLWTDSRYFLQAAEQLAGSGFQLYRAGEPGVQDWEEWLADTLMPDQRVGANPWLFSINGWKALADKLSARGVALVAVADDLVDQVWGAAQPPMPNTPVRLHPRSRAGESVENKLGRLWGALEKKSAAALLVCDLAEIAWTFNLRGGDVDFNPVFIAFALIEPERATLFTDAARIPAEALAELPACVKLQPYGDVEQALSALAAAGAKVWVDPTTTNRHFADILAAGGAVLEASGPIAAWKAAKNEVEVAGMAAAHVRDGVAMVRFLRWLEQAVPAGGVSELSAQDHLAALRAEGEGYVGLSFGTISGYAGHGAIVHYSATEESNAVLAPGGIYLIDSGGQYVDGTTDITRTVALGAPTAEQKQAYTAVLRGHLQLGRAIFRAGTDGYQLDVLARAPVWEALLNYGHGTGHGVGAHLSVHEGPFSVSLRKNMIPLVPGNILSNEPGFYKPGEYGIRIENLVLVVQKAENEWGTFLGFQDLTLCPYDLALVDEDLLAPAEKAQINAYHMRVQQVLAPLLGVEDLAWLQQATRPL